MQSKNPESILSDQASEAINNFELQLKFLGKDVLDEEGFNLILDSIGYKCARDGLFDSLLDDVNQAYDGFFDVNQRIIEVEDMMKLYASDRYHLLDSIQDTGAHLMEYGDKIFDDFDTSGDGIIDRDKARTSIVKLLGKEPSDEEIDELFATWDKAGNGEIDRYEFKKSILRVNKNDVNDLPGNLNHNLFSPFQAEPEDFVNAFEEYCKSHEAMNHHLFENIACAAYGKTETTGMILLFLSCYSKFNAMHVGSIQRLIRQLKEPHYRAILKESLYQELGLYEKDTLDDCAKMGISPDSIENITHVELYKDLIKNVEQKLKYSYKDCLPEDTGESLANTAREIEETGIIGHLASLYFGCALIVPYIYLSLLIGLQLSSDVTMEEAKFLYLNCNMDSNVTNLRTMIVDHCKTQDDRMEFARCSEKILNAYVEFYNTLRANSHGSLCEKVNTSKFYDKKAKKCDRDKPRILSDFTCRPLLYKMISDFIKGASVLDIGCGEGYVGRKMIEMGAGKVIGVDVSPAMIEMANSHIHKGQSEYYVQGDASKLKALLVANAGQTNMMLGAGFDVGIFDLSVGVFLFDYMTISDMGKTFKDVFTLLKPGGHFVFSVTHPFMVGNGHEKLGFGGDESGYFGLRDKILEGHISTIAGEKLSIRMVFKTIEDYINVAMNYGFEVVEFKEARVKAEHMWDNPEFFGGINDVPLHLVMKIRKPSNTQSADTLGKNNSIDMLPKKLNWNKILTNNISNSLIMKLSAKANLEIINAALHLFDNDISVDGLDIGRDLHGFQFDHLKPFAAAVRNRLLHETGAVIIQGLDMNALGGVEELDKMTEASKLAYLLVCEHIGSVDSTTRGKLFDVKCANIDAMSKKADNVLFSVSDSAAGWHTDGASKDRVYDVVSLLCISPAATGGKFRISNACDAYDDLKRVLPGFLMYELMRGIPRDILENGNGKGTVGASVSLSRMSSLLAMRIRYNSYPIYKVEGDTMRFRYMRHWIETGFEKTNWKVPTLLKIAMDMLDDSLDKLCAFYQCLDRGDMIFANNAVIAHARDQFKNAPGAPPRHKVRAWIQVQKTHLLHKEQVKAVEGMRSSS